MLSVAGPGGGWYPFRCITRKRLLGAIVRFHFMRTSIRVALLGALLGALGCFFAWRDEIEPAVPPSLAPRPIEVATTSVALPAVSGAGEVLQRQTNFTVAFQEWSRRFVAGTEPERQSLHEQGKELAVQRRKEFEQLIKTDPRAALERTVPDEVRRQLPADIQAQLEQRVSGQGFFGVLIADNPEAGRREVTREVILDHRRYEAYVYGRRFSQVTREREKFWGVAIGSSLAVHENPVRPLSVAESAGLDARGNCPVSGLPVTTHGAPAFAEVAGRIEKFCGAGHLAALSQRLAAEGGVGGDGGEPPIS